MAFPRFVRRGRRKTFSETIAEGQRPTRVQPTVRQTVVEPQQQMNEEVADAVTHLIRIAADTLGAIVFGFAIAVVLEALSEGTIDRDKPFKVITGLTIAIVRILGSRTAQEWIDWLADIQFAREMQQNAKVRQQAYLGATQTARLATRVIESQPSAEEQEVNETLARILRDYYDQAAAGILDPKGKLWSRRNLATQYNLAEGSKANVRVREILDPLADGYHLKPSNYTAAFVAVFGCEPGEWDPRQLRRIADNPATGEPVLQPLPRVPPEVIYTPEGLVLKRTRRIR